MKRSHREKCAARTENPSSHICPKQHPRYCTPKNNTHPYFIRIHPWDRTRVRLALGLLSYSARTTSRLARKALLDLYNTFLQFLARLSPLMRGPIATMPSRFSASATLFRYPFPKGFPLFFGARTCRFLRGLLPGRALFDALMTHNFFVGFNLGSSCLIK